MNTVAPWLPLNPGPYDVKHFNNKFFIFPPFPTFHSLMIRFVSQFSYGAVWAT